MAREDKWTPRRRAKLAWEMRAAGYNYSDIAKACQYGSKDTARNIVTRIRTANFVALEERQEHYRQTLIAEIEEMKQVYVEKIESRDFKASDVDTYLRLQERIAKLTGADQPQQVEISHKPVEHLTVVEIQQRLAQMRDVPPDNSESSASDSD